MKTATLPPPKSEIRLTIPVSLEVHAVFTRIAKAGNIPVGRAMGEWLADTVDAATFMATTMEKARKAPKLVAQELHAYALGIGDQSSELLNALREKGRADRAAAAGDLGAAVDARKADQAIDDSLETLSKYPALGDLPPRTSNTGGKVSRKPGKRGNQ